MKNMLVNILNKYLKEFPEESERQTIFKEYLNIVKDEDIVDWNNFNGHVVAGGFIYARENKKFLVMFHKDLKMYLYPGGHMIESDEDPLEAAKREIAEETGLRDLCLLKLIDDELVPIDIDTQWVPYNERLDLPRHYHFDLRYLFAIDRISDLSIDDEELGDYQWIDMDELSKDIHFGDIAVKIKAIIGKESNQ